MTRRILMFCLCLALCGCVASSARKTTATERLGSKEVDLHLTLVESYLVNQEYQRALQELITIEPQAKHLSRYHFDSGMTFLGLAELDKAHAGFARAVEIDDDFGEAWNNLGKIQEGMNRPAEAEASYRKAMSILTYLTPEFPICNLGSMFMRQGRAKEAEEMARKALARNWRYSPAYRLLGEALRGQGRMNDAESALKSGLEADMNSVATMLALGELQMRIGKNIEAREMFRRIVNQYPKSNEAKVAQDYMEFLQ